MSETIFGIHGSNSVKGMEKPCARLACAFKRTNQIKYSFVIILLAFAHWVTGQIVFEPGYVIGLEGDTLYGEIRNKDWNDSPERITFKTSGGDVAYPIRCDTLKEFGIGDEVRYVRHIVLMDMSPTQLKNLTRSRAPILVEDTLILRVLVQGNASLLLHKHQARERFFFSVNQQTPNQLVYKKYRTSNGKIITNRDYREQLRGTLKCGTIDHAAFDALQYNVRSLGALFVDYNSCAQSSFEQYVKRSRKGQFYLTLQPGYRISQMLIETNWNTVDFGVQGQVVAGLELEYILPFNQNKWGLFVAPLYQSYNGAEVLYIYESELHYRSVELAMGLRHYFFLGRQSKLYVNVASVVDFATDSEIVIEGQNDLDIATKSNIAVGLGCKFLQKFSGEVRYGFKRELKEYGNYPGSKYTSWNFIVGFTLF